MVTMTTVISKDGEWLKNEIECGIESFLDMEHEHIVKLLMRYVYEQIFLSGCCDNIESPGDDPVKFHIVIDIPVPDKCVDIINSAGRKEALSDI